MSSVSLDTDLALNLVNSKLTSVTKEIEEILARWEYDDADLFLKDAREGKLEEAEDDAIDLTNLLDIREDLFNLKKS